MTHDNMGMAPAMLDAMPPMPRFTFVQPKDKVQWNNYPISALSQDYKSLPFVEYNGYNLSEAILLLINKHPYQEACIMMTTSQDKVPVLIANGYTLWLPKRSFSLFTLILLSSISLFILAGCSSQPLTLTASNNGKSIQAHVGDTIVLQLDENPTTGYVWAIDKNDNSMLMLQSSNYTQTPGGASGSGGTHVFTFIAKRSGTAHLQLKMWRSFQGNSSIIRRYSVTINIQS